MTGNVRRFAAGFTVEGIGLEQQLTDPLVWCDQAYKASEANANTTSYRWTNGRCEEPNASGYSTDPFRGRIDASSITLFVHNNDANAERFRFTDTQPTTTVTSAIDSADATVTIGDTSLADSVVYVGDESIRLGSHTGGGTYNATRGVWGSEAQDHSVGDYVYSRGAPYWRGRRVRWVVHNLETEEERIPWRGYIQDIDTTDDGTKIRLSLGELVSAGMEAKANVDAQPIKHDLEARLAANGRKYVSGSLLTADSDEVYYQPKIREATEWDSSGRIVWVQADDALVMCRENQAVDYYPSLRLGSELETDIEDGELSARLEGDVFEVFCVNPRADALVQDQFGSGEWASSTAGLRDLAGFYDFDEKTAVHHPWSVGLALINSGTGPSDDLSVWEELKDAWGLGLSWAMVEGTNNATDTVRRLIEDFPYLRIDNLVLGWDGKPFNPWREAIYKCFLPFGLIPGVTNEGLPTFKRFGLMDIEQYNDALANELTPILNTNAHHMGHGSTADRITAVVGELPWKKGGRIEERAQGNSKRNAKLAKQGEFEIDYSVVAAENYEAVAGNLLSQSRMAHYAMPRWLLRFDDYDIDDLDYTVGEYVSLSRWPVQGNKPIDPNTAQATLDVQGKAWATGLVIGRTPSFSDHTYELEILLTSYIIDEPARWRAPSMVVTSSAEQASTTRIYTDATSNFGFGAPDNESFRVGDEVALWLDSGAFVVDAGEIVDIGSDGTGDYIEVDLLGSVSASLIVRLDTYDDYSNTTAFANVDRIWAFLADANDTLGAAGDGGDVYGTLWVGPSNVSDYTGDYDGGEFRALDSDVAAADEPADTFLDHGLRNNEFYLYHYAARFPVEFGCSTNNTDIAKDISERLLTGLSEMVIAMGRFPVARGLDTITTYWHAGVCDTAFDGNGDVELIVQLVTDYGYTKKSSVRVADTTADTIEVQYHKVSLDVSDVQTSPGARLLFKVRGYKSTTTTGDISVGLSWPDRISLGANDDYEQGAIITDTDGNPIAETVRGDLSVNNSPTFHPARELPDEVELYAMGAVALRGIHVETTYRGGGDGFVEYTQEEIAAQQAIGGSVAQRHQRNANHLLTRPNVRAFGACGGDDGNFGDARHEYMWWTDFADAGTSYDLGPARSCVVRADPCRLDVSLDLLCIQQGLFTPDTSDYSAWLQDNAASVELGIEVTVTELASGGNTTTTEERRVTFDFYPSLRIGPYMALHAWSSREYGAGGADVWRSGHLNNLDLALLQRATVPVTLSGHDVTNPVKVEVAVSINDFTKVQDGTGPNDITDFRVQMCGYSVVENN